jgi:hypothetical protein
MISVVTKNALFYKRQEIWFYNNETFNATDNDMFYSSSVKPNFKTDYVSEALTSIINLNDNADALYKNLDSDLKYEIRRAQKNDYVYKIYSPLPVDMMNAYYKTHKKFEEYKGLSVGLDYDRVANYVENKCLILSIVSLNKTEVTYHSYITDRSKKVVLFNSYYHIDYLNSRDRGYANRYHHWMDIMNFKENGYQFYDWGGIDFINTPQIAWFKQTFGGEKVMQYNFLITSKLYTFVKKCKGLIKYG